jgi:hypothetical protein
MPLSWSARVCLCIALFGALALVDYWLKRSESIRWREYLFLFFSAAVLVAYGLVDDQLAASISWEYVDAHARELKLAWVPFAPQGPRDVRQVAVEMALKATFAPGLAVGLLLLVANRPRAGTPKLGYRELAKGLGPVVLAAAICGAVLASVEYVRFTESNERRFMAVWGMHLGGYVGGGLGTGIGVWRVAQKRRRSRGEMGLRQTD